MNKQKQSILFTRPFLPPQSEYDKMLNEIWSRNWLTNDGPFVKQFESKMSKLIGNKQFLLVSNGTIGLQLSLKALNITGQVITTPFSYVATLTSLIWENCEPIFVDIDSATLNIDASKIESKITRQTRAILATHIFGNPCDIDLIQEIADKHNLKVIYDAAHCFGTLYKGQDIMNFGDISVTSLHATKIFHTIEGGGITAKNKETAKRISYMRNFGHDGPGKFNGVGINAKNSEFHAAMGLVNFKYIKDILKVRAQQYKKYSRAFKNDDKLQLQKLNDDARVNYSYFPLIFNNEEDLLRVERALNSSDIFPRRYFYPSLNKVDYLDYQNCPISEKTSESILCLPMYHELSELDQEQVIGIIKDAL